MKNKIYIARKNHKRFSSFGKRPDKKQRMKFKAIIKNYGLKSGSEINRNYKALTIKASANYVFNRMSYRNETSGSIGRL